MSLHSLFENESIQEQNETPGNLDSLNHHGKTNIKNVLPQVVAALVSSLFHVIAGISMGYLLVTLGHPQTGLFDNLIHLFRAATGIIFVSIGGLVCGFLIDTIGRLNTIKLAALPGIIGFFTTAVSDGFLKMFAARFLTGIAVACGTFPAIVYITEIAHPDIRGALLSIGPAFTLLGSIVSFWIEQSIEFRTFMFITIMFPIVASIPVVFIPESPIWLISKGRNEQALKSLEWLDKNQPPPTDTMTFAQLHYEHLLEEHRKTRPRNGFREKAKEYLKSTFYKPFLILLGLFVLQQSSGVHLMAMYFITHNLPVYITDRTFSNIYVTLQAVSIISNFFLLRLCARRTLMLYGPAAMAVCMLIYLSYINFFGKGYSPSGWIPAVAIFLCFGISMISIIPVPWTMIAELFPHQIRGISYCMVYSLANLMLPLSFLVLTFVAEYTNAEKTFDWFCIAVLIMLLFTLVYTYFLLPETHQVNLSDVQKCFESNRIYIKWLRAKKRESSRQNEEITMNDV